MRERKILIVEDNEDNLTLLVDLLVSLGYGAISARDGQTGVDMVRAERPDLILMDLSLPVLDGWSATRILKADPDLMQIPVIALTAHAMMGDRQRALEAGCDDYVTKPIKLAELISRLEKYLPPQNRETQV
jgi:two-component system, cell cycle response regulator DivK